MDSVLLQTMLTVIGVPEREHDAWRSELERRKPLVELQHKIPCEESKWFQRRGRAVRERIARLNGGVLREGEIARGWHPKPRVDAWASDYVTPKMVMRDIGRDGYRAIPASAWRHSGHRKFMTRLDYIKLKGTIT